MRKSFGTFAIGVLFVSIVTLVLSSPALALQQPAPPAGQSDNASVRSFEGQLTKIDSTAKTITVKGSDNKEMIFSYNDQTQVMGADDGVQGLVGKTGSSLKVSYRENRGTNQATKIELQPNK
jgi:hypothetical protein